MAKFVSIIIPCRNEEKYMAQCLDSALAQDYPSDSFEILVAEGMSTDKTRFILKEYAARHSCVRWFENVKKIVPCGLNMLTRQAKGEVIIRLDAHSYYPKDYVSQCVKNLLKYEVDNVGGVWKTLPGSDTLLAKAISLALTSPFGVGASQFRLGVDKPMMVDTVPFGCYHRAVFDKIGYFNEELIRNQDNEFNARLSAAGGKILLHPDIQCSYFARPDIASMVRQCFMNGFWCIYGLKFSKKPFFLRHLVPMALVSVLFLSFLLGIWWKSFLWGGIFVAGLYSVGVILAAVFSALKNDYRCFFYLLLIFPLMHFSYGIGSLGGLIQLLVGRSTKVGIS